jgi:pyruvate dehydrogenase E2 component (dihydrolipoamide acetyltransferase)
MQTGLTPYSWQGRVIDSAIMEMPTFSLGLPPATPSAVPVDPRKVRSSPAARAAARIKGVNLGTVVGTGPRGRVTRADVLRHAAGIAPAPAAPAPTPRAIPLPTPNQGDEVVPNNNMRRTIAKRLKAAHSDAPTFFLTVAFDCDAMVTFRNALKAGGNKVSYNDIILAACGRALRDVPDVNAAWAEDSIIKRAAVDIGIAVALPGGLITPVIRDADTKSLADIATETRALATKAKKGKLGPDEYTGSTFTISNLGMKGVEQFTAILNPPEACILAVGALAQEPVVKDGKTGVGWRMKVTLTCDHRVVDGALGADFLAAVSRYIEDPSGLNG